MAAADMETVKIEIMFPQACKDEAEEFADFFHSMEIGEKRDFLKHMTGMKMFKEILESQRAG